MQFPKSPIEFLDLLIDIHKAWIKARPVASETIAYMGENVDQPGRGIDWMRHMVCNDVAKETDPNSDDTDLALLELYRHWRQLYGMRPIEKWDGTTLRPWLSKDNNPKIPHILNGNLHLLKEASYRHLSWKQWLKDLNRADINVEEMPHVVEMDVLGNIAESYVQDIREYAVWAEPLSAHQDVMTNDVDVESGLGAHGNHHEHNEGEMSEAPGPHHDHGQLGSVRLYRHNDFNNIELAPYSIRFWGYLQWIDSLRRTVIGEPQDTFEHDEDSDITFMHNFNQNHFPWHDNIYNTGPCEQWDNEYGQRKHHIYPRGTQGYCLEFLKYHSDLMKAYNKWLTKLGYPTTDTWRDGNDPFEPGRHHSAYMLRTVWGSESPWGLAHSNGYPFNYREQAPELFDINSYKFETVAELGYFYEGKWMIHGSAHVENCDFRDQYVNNYSLRFFHWHQWIDETYQRLVAKGVPLIKEGSDFNDSFEMLALENKFDPNKFTKGPAANWPLNGKWSCHIFSADSLTGSSSALQVFELEITQQSYINISASLKDISTGKVHELRGEFNSDYVYYDSEPYPNELTPWFDERIVVSFSTIEGATSAVHLRGNMTPLWKNSSEVKQTITGSCSFQKSINESKIFTFIMTRLS